MAFARRSVRRVLLSTAFYLRGNQRTSGERSRKEGGKVFGEGSRTPIAITLLVKNPDAPGACDIRCYDIGDYLTQEAKLAAIEGFGSVEDVPWEQITPNEAGDWINQRSEAFAVFAPLGEKRDATAKPVFDNHSIGVITNRDVWTYNFSRAELIENMRRTADFYNQQVARFSELVTNRKATRTPAAVDSLASILGKLPNGEMERSSSLDR